MLKILWDLETPSDHLISARTSDLVPINKKKKTGCLGDFAVKVDFREERKESKKIDKFLDLDK